MSLIDYSKKESEILKLKIGRVKFNSKYDIKKLNQEIFQNQFDICRLKMSISDSDVFNQLNEIPWPYSIHSILVNQQLNLLDINKEELNLRLVFKEVDQTNHFDLVELAKEVFKKNSMNMYFKNPIYDNLVDNKKSKDALLQYIFDFDNKDTKNTYLGYLDDKLVGFCMLEQDDNITQAVLAGIHPNYRNQNLFADFVKYQIIQSKLKGAEIYNCNTIIFNVKSLNATIRRGLQIKDVYYNINICPLLNITNKISIKFKSNLDALLSNIQEVLRAEIGQQALISTLKFSPPVEIDTNKNVNWFAHIYQPSKTLIFYSSDKSFVGNVKYF